jgi:hypothetical protein
MPSILLWNLVKKLPTTETEFVNTVYVKNQITRASQDELLRLIEEGRKEGSKNYRDSLQALLDAREVDGDVEMADADQGNESDATVVGVSRPKIELSRPSSTLWDSATGEWMGRCVGLSFEIVCVLSSANFSFEHLSRLGSTGSKPCASRSERSLWSGVG